MGRTGSLRKSKVRLRLRPSISTIGFLLRRKEEGETLLQLHQVNARNSLEPSLGPRAYPNIEYASSPKKRRTTIGSQQLLASQPTSEPRYQSTSFVHVSSPASSTAGGRRGGHKRQASDSSSRAAFPAATRRNRSRGNTESSQADLDEIKRTRQGYPIGGGEDRSDSGSISSYGGPPSTKRSRFAVRSEMRSASGSPKREPVGYRMPGISRKNSFGGSSAA